MRRLVTHPSSATAAVDRHLAHLRTCSATWRGHHLPLATPPGQRYPYVYPRDLAAVARAFDRIPHDTPARQAHAHEALLGSAAFVLATQGADGLWGQRYDQEGRDRAIYKQEDNTAHAIAVLARHVRLERRRGGASPFEGACFEAIVRGFAGAITHHYRREINLYHSTTSIHESAMEHGYTLWTNGAYRDAYRLALEAATLAGRDDLVKAWSPFHERHDANIRRHFVQTEGWIRALTPTGRFDRRPDVTLLSPFYFRFEDLDPDASERAATRAETELWDPDLGLFQRYLPFREDRAVHTHAGNGPWLAYSLWIAQRHAAMKRTQRARDLLDRVEAYATAQGHLPEHVSTRDRFLDFHRNEWETGLDFQKEFDGAIMLPHVPFSQVLEETVRMQRAYDDAARVGEAAGDGIIRFAAPLAWTHAEAAVTHALLAST